MKALPIALAVAVALTLFGGVASAAGRPATARLFVVGNLDARAAAGAVVTARARVVDTTGARHDVTFSFVKVANASAWDWEASTTDPTVVTPNPLAAGTLVFSANGRPQTIRGLPEGALNLSYYSEAEPQTIWVEMDTVFSRRGRSLLRILP
jgi:hypothetical protein